jgi:hypothetical protein
MCGRQFFEETATEQSREHAHGQEETRPAPNPALAIEREPAAGHDAVYMRMMGQRRAPSVQDQGHADLRPEMLGVGSE